MFFSKNSFFMLIRNSSKQRKAASFKFFVIEGTRKMTVFELCVDNWEHGECTAICSALQFSVFEGSEFRPLLCVKMERR